MEPFRFKHFQLSHEASTQRIGTDSVLLAALVPLEGVHAVLDVGCGCGVIGFCIADRLRRAGGLSSSVTGIDVDAASVAEARANADNFAGKTPVAFCFQQVALQEFRDREFDLIVSNPPYFVSSIKPADERRRLARHSDTSLPFSDFIRHTKQLLSPKGKVFVILPQTESIEFETLAKQQSLFLSTKIKIQPTPGKPINRVILGFSSEIPAQISTQEICIRDSGNDFSELYRNITRDFYLDF